MSTDLRPFAPDAPRMNFRPRPRTNGCRRHARRAALSVAAIATLAITPVGSRGAFVVVDTNKTIEAGDTSLQVPTSDIRFASSNTNLTLAVQNGGYVDGQNMYVAYGLGTTATVIADGPGSLIYTHDVGGDTTGNFDIGERGNATLTVRNGAQMHTWRAWTAYYDTSTAVVTVTDPGTVWTNDFHFYVGAHGNGSLYVQNGATINTFRGRIGEFSGSTGYVNVGGLGTSFNVGNELTVGGGATAHGTFDLTAGATAIAQNVVIGVTHDAFGTVNVDGTGGASHWTASVLMHVGSSGNGALNVSHGARVDSGFTTIGRGGEANGQVTVDGAGSILNCVGAYGDVLGPAINVGYWGHGSLAVTNGGRVQSKAGAIGTGFGINPAPYGTGQIFSGVGVATIDGPGSVWHNDLTLTIGQGTVDPNNKTTTPPAVRSDGTLNVTNGGLVEDTAGTLGATTATIGRANVSGAGSQWNNSTTLSVGSANSGTVLGGIGILNVSAGGTVSATGAATIHPQGSFTNNGGTLAFGTSATAANVTNNGSFAQTAGTLNVNSSASAGGQFTNAGTADLAGTLNFGANGKLTNTAGTTTLRSDPAPAATPTLTVNVNGGTVNFAAPAVHLAALNVSTGGTANVPANGSRVLVTKSLSVAGTGKLDLADNDAVVDYTGSTVATATRALITSARGTGAWDGPGGITSSAAASAGITTIALAESNDLLALAPGQTGTFDGQTVDATAVLLKYTYYGDANFDGRVNGDDLAIVDRYVASHAGSPATARWMDGDFDYSGSVDAADYLLLDRSYGIASGGLSPAFIADREARFGTAYAANLLAIVPEPTTGAVTTGLVTLMAARRRRRA